MKKGFQLFLLTLFVVVMILSISDLLPPGCAFASTQGGPIKGHIIVWEHSNMNGSHAHFFITNYNLYTSGWANKISSFVVLEGQVYFSTNVQGAPPRFGPCGPGVYTEVTKYGIPNDKIKTIVIQPGQ